MKVCLIGGGNPSAGELDDVMDAVSRYTDASNKVLIIPFATEESKRDKWVQSAKIMFADIGLVQISLLDDSLTSIEMQQKIETCEILYFTGGRPELLMNRLIEKNLLQAIQGFSGMMIGVSAGALIFCKDCLITKDDDYPETHFIKGLGILDYSVEVHYGATIDEELIPLSQNRDIYAIPNGSAILCDGNITEYIHDVYHFKDGNKQLMGSNSAI
ncbi:Peptidase E [Bacillus sp. OV322]|uniref:Type 1 glutamine amidotransferase-like domain-containing protein n=1 Tax=Bacillus sp. OV322 TaxID=1882764 RepID=UPI0008E21E58|nr:Type 1 glutamine amidotransferase-like domain-containing protein [Bacillus sp. OV322]SFC95171.1 Peptidase E [Bacillus sp. OV322]